MVFFALVVALGQISPPKTLTYTNPGARLEVVLPELSKLTGMTLRASPQMAGRAVILRLDHAPIQKALERIAHASYGKWGPDQGAYVLYRDNGRIATEAEAAKQDHISDVAKALARIGTVKTKPQSKDAGADVGTTVGVEATPMTEVIHTLISAFDPAVIGTLQGDTQVVYSTRPTPLQIGLPNGSVPVFEGLLAQLRTLPVATADGENPPGSPNESSQIGDLTGSFSKADINVSQNGSYGLNFSIKLFNDQGKRMFSGQVSKDVGNDDPASPDTETTNQDKSPGATSTTGAAKSKPTPLELSQVVKDFLRANAGVSPVSPALRERLQDPLTYDPLSFMGEIDVACAAAMHWQLVACPADYMALTQGYAKMGLTPTAESVAPTLASGDDGKDGWIEVSDSIDYPDSSTTGHLDRHRLALAIKAIPKSDSISLMDEVNAYRAGVSDLQFLPESWLCEKLIGAISQNQMISLLSKLSDDEIDLLLSGKTLYIGSVSPSFQSAFSDYSQTSDIQPELENADGSIPPSNPNGWVYSGPRQLADAPRPARTDDLWQEFTELCNTYAPALTSIRLTSTSSKSLTVLAPPGAARHVRTPDQALSEDYPDWMSRFGSDGGPSTITFSGGGGATFTATPGPPMPEFGVTSEILEGLKPGQKYRMGTNNKYTLTMIFAPFVYCQETAATTTFDADSKPVAMEDLSSDTQKAIRAYLQRKSQWRDFLRQQRQQSGDSGGSGP